MIAAVTGEVLSRRNDHVVIDAGGVGYRLAVSAETLRTVPAVGERVSLHAHLIARDDSLALYGFATEDERELFLSLTTVSGVGPKVAMATLSGGSVGELLRALAAGDAKRFQAVPGIGKRTAERIIVELRERVAGELDEAAAVVTTESTAREEAREGLLGLGYTPTRPSACSPRPRARAPRRSRLVAPRGRRRGQGRVMAIERIPASSGDRSRRRAADRRCAARERGGRARPLPAAAALAEFVNQGQVTEQLTVFIEAARRRGEPLDHVLLAGPPGLGKTSLAHIIAAELGVPLIQTAGPALERKADVAAFLTALEPGSVFFIDEIHRLNRAIEETLYPAMEDRQLPVVLGQGAGARTVTLDLPDSRSSARPPAPGC